MHSKCTHVRCHMFCLVYRSEMSNPLLAPLSRSSAFQSGLFNAFIKWVKVDHKSWISFFCGSDVEKLDPTKQTHLAAYEHLLNDCCKISFCWYVKDSKLNWRDLTGPEKIRLFNLMDIPTVFPSLPQKNEIQHLWSTFTHLINSLKRPDCDADDLESGAKQWVRHFCSIYQTKHVTPYVHKCTCYACTRIYSHIWKHL